MPLEPFTEPRTWTDTEFVDDDIMNAHVRGNFRSMGPHFITRTTGDQAFTTSTLANDDTLVPPTITANDVWLFEYVLSLQNTTSSDLKVGFTFPSGDVRGLFDGVSGQRGVLGSVSPASATMTTTIIITLPGAIYTLKVLYTCGGTGGLLNLQLATNGVGTMTRKANSTLWGVRLSP